MEDILKAIASGLKLDAEQFLADFKNGDDYISEKEAAEKLATFIPDKVKAANETAKKVGRSEVQKRFSRLIKDSGFDNPDNAEGDALLTAFIEWKGEQSAHVDGDPGKMSKEDLLKFPQVQAIIKEVKGKEAERFNAEKSEWEKKVKAAENTRKSLLLDKTLLQVLEKGKINLGETPETRAVRLDFLKSRVPLDRVEIGDDGALKFLDKDGYETDFEKDFLPVAQTAFGVRTQDPNRGGSGAQGSGSGNGGGTKYVPVHSFPNGVNDLNTKLNAAKDNAERFQVHKDWKFHQEQQLAAGK